MDKVDLRKALDSYHAPRGGFRILEVPERRYLMIDGHGDPNSSPAFTDAVQALYPVAYTLKFASREQTGRDYVVPPLEGLWWADDLDSFTMARDKSRWDWTMMLLVPDWIDEVQVLAALEQAGEKNRPARLDDVRFEALTEGLCVQTLHFGSFDEEGPVLARLHHEFAPAQGLTLRGKHHEIYLSDFRRTAPARRRTILRQPVERIEPHRVQA